MRSSDRLLDINNYDNKLDILENKLELDCSPGGRSHACGPEPGPSSGPDPGPASG